MRRLLVLLGLAMLACRGEDRGEVGSAVDSSLPGPQRAAAAAARVRPLLEPDLAELGLKFGDPVFLRAFKEEQALEVWMRPQGESRFVLFRSYPIAAASGRPGPKLAEGDRQVPEGFYAFGRRHLHPASKYHLAFNIGYPNEFDRHHERTGSFIMVHGNRVSIGCLAMTDVRIEEIYTLVDAALDGGQPFVRIHLFPFRMTPGRMEQVDEREWAGFWRNLREGYEFFETHRRPPVTEVEEGRYVFEQGA